jgi:nicotinamide-nucleotide amidase
LDTESNICLRIQSFAVPAAAYCCIMGVCWATSFMVREGYRRCRGLRVAGFGGDSFRVARAWSSLFGSMGSDPDLNGLAERVAHKLRAAERRLVTAESCTGGWVSKVLTDIAGSSGWFECGFVTYSNAAKVRDLGVSGTTLEQFGAVSEQSVREMAEGALRVSGATVALAVTGIAGPDGGVPGKPVGTVWFCAAARNGVATDVIAEEKLFSGDRAFVRARAVEHALRLILRLDLPVAARSDPN